MSDILLDIIFPAYVMLMTNKADDVRTDIVHSSYDKAIYFAMFANLNRLDINSNINSSLAVQASNHESTSSSS